MVALARAAHQFKLRPAARQRCFHAAGADPAKPTPTTSPASVRAGGAPVTVAALSFHHIYSKKKKQRLGQLARALGLAGFCVFGR